MPATELGAVEEATDEADCGSFECETGALMELVTIVLEYGEKCVFR